MGKIVSKLLSYTLKRKMHGYSCSILIIILTLIFVNYVPRNSIPEHIRFISFLTAFSTILMFLHKSWLVPENVSSSKKELSQNYSTNYFRSTIRYPLETIFAILIETFFDITLISIFVFSSIYHELGNELYQSFYRIWITIGVFLLSYRSYVMLSANSRYQRSLSYKLFNLKISPRQQKILIIILIFFVIGIINFYNLMSFNMFINIVAPSALGFFIFIICFSYISSTTDFNMLERKKYDRKVASGGVVLLLLSYSFYYIEKIRTGYVIFDAIETNNLVKIERIVKTNKDVLKLTDEESKLTPLHFAFKKNRQEAMKLLLKNGANVNELDSNGNNLMFSVANYCDYEMGEFLVKNGINPHFKNKFGKNAYWKASERSCLPLLMYFNKLKIEKQKFVKHENADIVNKDNGVNKYYEKLYEFYKRHSLIVGLEDL